MIRSLSFVLLLSACNDSGALNSQIMQRDAKKDSNSVPEAGAPAAATPQGTTPTEVIAEEQMVTSEAQAPAIIAGAYLSCMRSNKANTLGCEIMGSNKMSMNLPLDMTVRFAYVDANGLSSAPVEVKRVDGSSNRAMFFVELKAMTGRLMLEAGSTLGNIVSDFELSQLPANSPLVSYPEGWNHKVSHRISMLNAMLQFGDGKQDSGAGQISKCMPGGVGATMAHVRYTQRFTLSDWLYDSRLQAAGICGLDSSSIKVTLTMPNGTDQVTMFMYPSEDGSTQYVSHEFNFPPGRYTFEILTHAVANGNYEDAVIGALNIATQQTTNVTVTTETGNGTLN